ncbi:MAG: type II toxin-antitoxin system RelE/ParE family toxin [Halobacteriales archaeon]
MSIRTSVDPYTAWRDFDGLDDHARDRIATKLDEIVTDEWRDPPDHLEPLQGTPHDKLRIGPFRLGCRADRTEHILYVLRIRKRGADVYRNNDD